MLILAVALGVMLTSCEKRRVGVINYSYIDKTFEDIKINDFVVVDLDDITDSFDAQRFIEMKMMPTSYDSLEVSFRIERIRNNER